MEQIELLKHNEIAYNKLIDKLKENNLVSINHATGTGKSFIILKYLYQNRDKNILYLAPTYPILDQLINEHLKELNINIKSFKCLDTEIYSNLLKRNTDNIVDKYDILILDEYHRCGAKKWGKEINNILSQIKEEKRTIKVIGTTATEIRYLDHKKNMNNILFDGVNASTLSLADAILEGILPVFEYIMFPHNELNQLLNIEKRINNILVYEEENLKYNKLLKNITAKIEKNLFDSSQYKNYLDDKSKILVFSSSIDNINKDKNTIRKILDDKKYKEYEVTYKNGWKANNEIIEKFRNSSKQNTNILYAINLLNEGIHVKDIDAIFMMRTTKSPIIYFQQLGRLLSYSRRNDKLVVFDFENNIKNNKAIYNLYIEVIKRAQELLIQDPKNKKRYEYILDNFKIVSDASNIYKELDDLKELTSLDKLKVIRINGAIRVLSDNNNSEYLKLQALLDIYHYQEYITLSQFKMIKKLDIEKPSLFSLTEEEFSMILKDSINLRDKYQNKNKKLFFKIIEFYKKQNRLPTIFSNEIEEQKLAEKMMFYYEFLTINQQEQINSLIDDKLSLIEKINYNENIDNYNVQLLYNQIDECLNKKIYIGNNIIIKLKYLKENQGNIYINKIYEANQFYYNQNEMNLSDDLIINQSDNIKLKKIFDTDMKILFREEFSDYLKKYLEAFEKIENKKDYLNNISNEIIEFIKNNFRFPNFEKESEKKLFYKKIIFNKYLKEYDYLNKIDEVYNIIITELNNNKRKKTLEKLLLFMEENNGVLPTKDSKYEYEIKLYKECKNILSNLTEQEIMQINSIQDKNKNYRVSLIKRYIDFIIKRKRVPNSLMNDEYEIELALEYQKVSPSFNLEEKEIINSHLKKLNKYKSTRQLYLDMLKSK